MKKYLFSSIIILLSIQVFAQTELNYNKHYIQCINKWVAFKPDSTGYHIYGFVYFDMQAGLTFNYEGDFKITSKGGVIPKKPDKNNLIKARISPNNVLVAEIPSSKFKELQIDTIPEWLKFYEVDTNSVQFLYKMGFLHNAWQECHQAANFLEKAQKVDPDYKRLRVELAYSYNCLEKFEKAVNILKKAISSNPKDAYINKEYIYSLVRSGQINKAISHFNKTVKKLNSNRFNAENSLNILGYYYLKNDAQNFKKWYPKFQKYLVDNKEMIYNVKMMKKELEK